LRLDFERFWSQNTAVTIPHNLPRKILWVLGLIVSTLIMAHLASQVLKYHYGYYTQIGLERLLNLDGENNIPSWYASSTLLLCSGVLAFIWSLRRQQSDPDARYWCILAAIFLYLSIDEAASIHETVVEHIIWRIWPTLDTRGYSHYPWVFAGAAFVLIVGLSFLRFLFRLPSRTRLGFVVSGLVFVGGALGIDILEANHDDRYGRQTFGFAMFVAAEEGMEMIGVLIYLQTLFVYIFSCVPDTPVLPRPMPFTGSAAPDPVTEQQPNLGLPPIRAILTHAEPASSIRPRQTPR
jgi:hypothetical protein